MSRRTTIQKKLVTSSMHVIIVAFVIVIAIVAVVFVYTSQSAIENGREQVRLALEAKGRILVQNNSLALSGMVADNAFLSVQELVSRTVLDDSDVVYGIFMDASRKAWIDARDPGFGTAISASQGPQILSDSVSLWAAQQASVALREIPLVPFDVIEFCSPVFVDGEAAGYIRYGLSTRQMMVSAQQVRHKVVIALTSMLVMLLLLAVAAVWFSFLVVRKQSIKLSSPIIRLDQDAKIIAQGDYSNPIQVESDDEIGELAHSFEEMRQRIKLYTDHLEELVADKMRQVRDILDNIDQGLLTVNFDSTINAEYSRAAVNMLRVDDLQAKSFIDTLCLDSTQKDEWDDWVQLVRARHKTMRWDKLLKIAPVTEWTICREDGTELVLSFSYQKVFDRNGELSRLMVLVHDATESRRIGKIVQEEQLRHENEVRTILGLVNNLPELINDFFRDLDDRFSLIHYHLDQIQSTPQLVDHAIVAALFRDFHTIKGNAASYGFEQLGRLAHHSEDVLELLRIPGHENVGDAIQTLMRLLAEMRQERNSIEQTSQMLRGGKDSLVVCVAERKIAHVQRLARTIMRESGSLDSSIFYPLVEACDQLRRVSLGKLADKYAHMVERVGEKLGKKVIFSCRPAEMEVEPTFFLGFNEPLIHILRNAVDHGIETTTERIALGKTPEGHVILEVHEMDGFYVLEVQDDGYGIHPESLVSRALEKGLLTEAAARTLSRRQKLELIYLPGLSTKDEVSEISGRGVGMDVVKNGIEGMGGRISLESEIGLGTKVIIEVPTSIFSVT